MLTGPLYGNKRYAPVATTHHETYVYTCMAKAASIAAWAATSIGIDATAWRLVVLDCYVCALSRQDVT